MLTFLSNNSAWLLILVSMVGFIFPELANFAFPYLPAILFLLMLFTLAGMEQNLVISYLKRSKTWLYALIHNGCLTLCLVLIGYLLDFSSNLILALAAVGSTGSLFATPAIARSVGLDPLPCMATTIATTLLMPVALYISLLLLQEGNFNLDLIAYIKRLVIFIILPMLISVLLYRFVPHDMLKRAHLQLSQVTIILVFSFPLGLVGVFRQVFDNNPIYAAKLLGIAFFICSFFFIAAYSLYRKKGQEIALAAAITSGNRNVLLTWTVAGPFLGSEYLALIGALQLPIYLQPLIVKTIRRFLLN